MLTKGDLRYIFYTFSFLSRAWCFPAKFNRSNGSFHIESGGRRRKRFRIVLAILIAHVLLLSGKTFEAGAVSRNVPLEFLAVGILASIAGPCICVMAILVHQNLELQVKIWTEIVNRLDPSERASPFHQKTWEERWICYMPFFIHPMPLIWPIAYSVNPNLPFLLYGSVPAVLKCAPALVLCCLLEVVLTTFYASISIYFVFFVMEFGRQMRSELQKLKNKVVRFGLHEPECVRTAENEPQPLRFLEIEETIQSEARSRATPDAKDEMSGPAKIEVICEVKGKTRISGNVGHVGNHKLEVKEKNPVNFRKTREMEDEIRPYVEKRVWREFREDSKPAVKGVKKRILKGAEDWVVKKAGEWAVKKGETWAGRKVGKWAEKKSGKWAMVRKVENWPVKTEKKWAQEAEEKRAVKKEDNQAVVNLEMDRIEEVNAETTTTTTNASKELKTACTTLEAFRLHFRLFNLGFANTIFLLKVVALAVTILGMFAAVRLAGSHPEFACLYALYAFVCFNNYIVMFNNAFHLTGQGEEIKALILLQSTTLLNRGQQSKEEWNEIRCRIAAIPRLAMYSGHFHALERDSTPVFIHFVLQKVADLLLAF